MAEATAAAVAAWMDAEFERAGTLAQAAAAEAIRANFGAAYAPAGRVRKDVLAAFNRLGAGGIIWSHQAQAWRRRNAYDPPFRGRVG